MEMEAVIIEILEMYGKSIYNFCFYLTGERCEAEDLYQDTILKVWEKRNEKNLAVLFSEENHEEPNKKLKNHFLGVAANIWKNKWRKKMRHSILAPIDENEAALGKVVNSEGNPEEMLIREEVNFRIRELVDNLSPKLKQVVVMYYAGQMTTEEIAHELRIPASTVRGRLFKAKKILNQQWKY